MQVSKGGVFGISKALSVKIEATDNAEFTITACNRIDVEAGKDGYGALSVAGSTQKSSGDMSFRAEGDVQVVPVQIENDSKVAAQRDQSAFTVLDISA